MVHSVNRVGDRSSVGQQGLVGVSHAASLSNPLRMLGVSRAVKRLSGFWVEQIRESFYGSSDMRQGRSSRFVTPGPSIQSDQSEVIEPAQATNPISIPRPEKLSTKPRGALEAQVPATVKFGADLAAMEGEFNELISMLWSSCSHDTATGLEAFTHLRQTKQKYEAMFQAENIEDYAKRFMVFRREIDTLLEVFQRNSYKGALDPDHYHKNDFGQPRVKSPAYGAMVRIEAFARRARLGLE